MKKILLFIFVLLTGCSSDEIIEDNSVYMNGTYTTIADGYGSDFEVSTTIENDQIVDIVVASHNETPSIGGVAMEAMIDSMITNNSTQVDIISGATKTSNALITAVNEALNQAKKDSN